MKHGTNHFWRIILVLLAILVALWCATEWTICSLGWSPNLDKQFFAILDVPIHAHGAFFDGSFSLNACAPDVFNRGRQIAGSGSVAAIVIAVTGFVLRVRREKNKDFCNFRPLNPRGAFRDPTQGVHAVVAPRNLRFTDVLIRQKAYCAC